MADEVNQLDYNNKKFTDIIKGLGYSDDKQKDVLDQFNTYWAYVDKTSPQSQASSFNLALSSANSILRLNSVYTIVNANSAYWNTSIANLLAGSTLWNSVYTTVKNNSASWLETVGIAATANWNSVYSQVNANSASWDASTTIINLSSIFWSSVYTNVNGNSANWQRAYVMSNILGELSANAQSVYSQVNSNSSIWASAGNTTNVVNSNSANWNRAYVMANVLGGLSANEQSVYSQVNSNSANWSAWSANSGNYATLQSNAFSGTQLIATDSTTQLVLSGSPRTTNLPFLSALQTWNNAGVTFQGFVIDIVDQNSAAASTPFVVRYNGIEEFKVINSPTGGISIRDGHEFRTNGGNGVIFTLGGSTWLDYANGNGVGLARDNGSLIFGGAGGGGLSTHPVLREDANYTLALKNADNAMKFRIYGVTSTSKYIDLGHDGNVANAIVNGGGSLNISASALWVNAMIHASAGNSDEWNLTYIGVRDTSANWNRAFVMANILGGLSANDTSVYSLVNSTSANWNRAFTMANILGGLSANNASVYSLVNLTSANWDRAFTMSNILATVSANNASVYSLVNSTSANWNRAFTMANILGGLSANDQSVYSTVNTNSATWGAGGDDVPVTNLVRATSANWNSVYSTVNSNSATWNSSGAPPKGVLTLDFGDAIGRKNKEFIIENSNVTENSIIQLTPSYKAIPADYSSTLVTLSPGSAVSPVTIVYGDSYYNSVTKYDSVVSGVIPTSALQVTFGWLTISFGNNRFVTSHINTAVPYPKLGVSQDGVYWTGVGLPAPLSGTDWLSSTYGNNQFVFLGQSTGFPNMAMTSPDGYNWTLRTVPNNQIWRDVTYGNGTYVAISTDGATSQVMYSSNGYDWTMAATTPNAPSTWRGLAYGNGRFVAVSDQITGSGSRVMVSTNNGVSWTGGTTPSNNWWTAVAYGNGVFVAVANGGATPNHIAVSYDGLTWTEIAISETINWAGIKYGNGLFIAGTSNRFATSPDGTNWTFLDHSPSPPLSAQYQGFDYGNGRFVATNGLFFGSLGMTNAALPLRTSKPSKDINYRSGAFVIPTKEKSILTYMDTGGWSLYSVSAINQYPPVKSMCFGNNQFVGLTQPNGLSACACVRSFDGVTWSGEILRESFNITDLTFGDDTFMAVASSGNTRVMASYDNAVTWFPSSAAEQNAWQSVTWGGSKFVAVANTGSSRIMITNTSVSGKSWSAINAPEQNSWNSITYGAGYFVAVASTGNNRIMISNNGTVWSAISAPTQNSWQSVTYGNGVFMANSPDGQNKLMYSTNAITWSSLSAYNASWSDIIFANGSERYSTFASIASTTSANPVLMITDAASKTLDEFEMDSISVEASVSAVGSFVINAESNNGGSLYGKYPVNFSILS